MIRAKRYPPPMPRYEEEEMTQQQFDAMMENYLKRLAQQTPGRLERGGARLGGEKRPDRGRRGGKQTVPQLFDARADGGADAAL